MIYMLDFVKLVLCMLIYQELQFDKGKDALDHYIIHHYHHHSHHHHNQNTEYHPSGIETYDAMEQPEIL